MSQRQLDDETTSEGMADPATTNDAASPDGAPAAATSRAAKATRPVADRVLPDLQALSDLAAVGAMAAGGNLAPACELVRVASRRRTRPRTITDDGSSAPRAPRYVLVRFAAALDATARPVTPAARPATVVTASAGRPVAAPKPAPAPATRPHPLADTGTVRADDVARAVANRATPFTTPEAPAVPDPLRARVSPTSTTAAPHVPARATVVADEDEGPSTVVHPVDPSRSVSPLPFRMSAPSPSTDARPSAPLSPLDDEDDAPRTRAIDLAALIAANPGAPLPFIPTGVERTPTPPPVLAPVLAARPPPDWARRAAERLTLAQFARVSAEIRESPVEAGRLRAALGLEDDAVWNALQFVWSEHFTRQPALRERFEALVGQFARRRRT